MTKYAAAVKRRGRVSCAIIRQPRALPHAGHQSDNIERGQGPRLPPLTEDRPKCLIEMSGRGLLEWQLDSLAAGSERRMA